MADEPTKLRGLAPHSTSRVPGPLGGRLPGGRLPGTLARNPAPQLPSAAIKFTPTRPIAFLDSSFTPKEQAKVLASLQLLTDDQIKLNGLDVYSDGSGKVASKFKTGQTLLRGLQYPTGKVTITPNATTTFPVTRPVGNDVFVDIPFSSGNLSPFHFFTLTGATVPVQGASVNAQAVEKSPGYVSLAHELVHAYRILRKITISQSNFRDHLFGDPQGNQFTERVFLEELTVVGIDGTEPITENNVRLEQGLGARMAYASPTMSLALQSVKPVSAQPSWWPDYPNLP